MDKITENKVNSIVRFLQEKKGEDIDIIDITGKTSYADVLVLCSGANDIHIQALADHVLRQCRVEKIRLLGKEGLKAAEWILLDYGEIIVHIFHPDTRMLYDLEDLWQQRAAIIERIEVSYD
ncbi:MAG: ribosome silencing factor [Candidatus Cloacimonetes bacterium]|nr:ribosome silencing factor [Candidatus Cloacimonadota bacterium]